MTRPVLSVVIVTRTPWPECEMTLRSLHAQVRALGAEIVLVDGSGLALPADGAGWPAVRWIRGAPGDTMYQLMARGLVEARGEIIATTEDHCAVPPGWCAAVLAVHLEHPDVDLVGGSVDNGARRRLLDWPNFLIINGAFLPPVPAGPTLELCGSANLSLKRRALPLTFGPEGMADYMLKADLVARGCVLWSEPRLIVDHVQSKPFAEAVWSHVVAGRSSTAVLHANAPAAGRLGEGLRRLLTLPYVAARDSYRLLAVVFRSKAAYRGTALLSFPGMVLLRAAHVVGEVLALLRGPGPETWNLR